MKICVPAVGAEGLSAEMSGHFGSAPYLTLIDTETGAWEVVENDHSSHDHGHCDPVGALEGTGVRAVVCAGMGRRAIARLNSAGIQVFRSTPGPVSLAVESYKAASLPLLDPAEACGDHGEGHHHGH